MTPLRLHYRFVYTDHGHFMSHRSPDSVLRELAETATHVLADGVKPWMVDEGAVKLQVWGCVLREEWPSTKLCNPSERLGDSHKRCNWIDALNKEEGE